jgi:hypothetical protein
MLRGELMFSLQQNWRKRQNRFCLDVRGVVSESEGLGDRWEK